MGSTRAIPSLLLLLLALGALLRDSQAVRECRHTNYIARDGRILAVDPADPSVETPITIKGAVWSGMEKDNLIPDGLFGVDSPNDKGTVGTKVSTLMSFLSNNSFNSVRLPLNADALTKDEFPQLAYIHGYDNRELTTWANPNNVRYFDLISRIIQTLQDKKLTVLLDVHLLGKYSEDAYWYTAPFVNITESPTYQAVSYMSKVLCNGTHWNVLGVDLKNAMTDVTWNAKAEDSNVKTDWRAAAEVLANRVVELCPQWLVFVGGASSPTQAQRFSVGEGYDLSKHWAGGNLKNASVNPIKMNVADKLVFAPQAHTHGKFPQNYFFSADSNCSTDAANAFSLEETTSECVDYIDGKKVKSKLPCSSSSFGCKSYKHLSAAAIATTYKKVLDEAMGDVVKANKAPVIFGSFSGVYGKDTQPQQSAVLDTLIYYAATSLRGGYFWALNPDSEYYLEDSIDKKSGIFGKTHYGVFKTTSWQEAHADLLEALNKLPSSEIPCYGDKTKKSSAVGLQWSAVVAMAAVAIDGQPSRCFAGACRQLPRGCNLYDRELQSCDGHHGLCSTFMETTQLFCLNTTEVSSYRNYDACAGKPGVCKDNTCFPEMVATCLDKADGEKCAFISAADGFWYQGRGTCGLSPSLKPPTRACNMPATEHMPSLAPMAPIQVYDNRPNVSDPTNLKTADLCNLMAAGAPCKHHRSGAISRCDIGGSCAAPRATCSADSKPLNGCDIGDDNGHCYEFLVEGKLSCVLPQNVREALKFDACVGKKDNDPSAVVDYSYIRFMVQFFEAPQGRCYRQACQSAEGQACEFLESDDNCTATVLYADKIVQMNGKCESRVSVESLPTR
ncbi:hypothetical protein P43SY_007105 [Pythium insidiosum]|uniref:Glycoside hydrolase family 5 domain-containing protein n=1 Tax=Pythium insidiosum TaxID=114742 RepID=A0AAD5L964_PYTIN|nr:hypothetical protein P43SY_007105 [Pythium insidiosum]